MRGRRSDLGTKHREKNVHWTGSFETSHESEDAFEGGLCGPWQLRPQLLGSPSGSSEAALPPETEQSQGSESAGPLHARALPTLEMGGWGGVLRTSQG